MSVKIDEGVVMNVLFVDAIPQNLEDYGVMITDTVHRPGLSISLYNESVEEGQNLDFEYTGKAVIRTTRILHRSPALTWLECYLNMTQIFVGLGTDHLPSYWGTQSGSWTKRSTA